MVMIRLSDEEAEDFKKLREQYKISARTIFEIMWHNFSKDETIIGYIRRSERWKGGGLKEIKIPRNIFQCKRASK